MTYALADHDGEVTLYTDGISGKSPSLERLGQKISILIKSRSLDSLLEEKRIHSLDITKMDIEGTECIALKGAEKLLRSDHSPRSIFLEIHPNYLPKFGCSVEELEFYLLDCGYHVKSKSERDFQVHVLLQK